MTLMKNRSLLNVLFVVLAAGLMTSCMGLDETDPSSLSAPQVKTFEVKDNGSLVFELSANVDKSASSRVAECGFYYSKDKSMSDAERLECRMTGGTFSADLTLRDYGETFYVCAYISNGSGSDEMLSDPEKIKLKELEEYVDFESLVVISYDKASAKVEVSYEVAEGVEVSEYGLSYGIDLQSGGNKLKAVDGTVSITDISPGKSYQMCPYLRDGENEIYGKPVSLAVYGTPMVLTVENPKTDSESAVLCGNVEDDCGREVTERGFVWCEGAVESLDPEKDTKIKSGSGDGEFSVTLAGLLPNRIYSFCAYAVNVEGLACGRVVRFTTGVALPVHGQPYITGLTSSSAVLNANVLSDGGEDAEERGFYWGPDAHTEHYVECGSSEFNYELNGLSRNATYYVKSYSKNSIGAAESKIISFTTMTELSAVVTDDVIDIEEYSATVSGSIEDDGGAEITDKGFVYGTSSGPDMETGHMMSAGSGSDSFSISLSGLSPNRTYYIRAYAVNSAGVSYGEEHVFTTKTALPSVGTISLEGKTSSMLRLTALILDDGGETPSEVGFYYSTSEDFTLSSALKASASLSGSTFKAEINGLARATIYHVRAYVVNSVGECLSEEVTLTTMAELPIVETSSVTDITEYAAMCGGNIVDDGGADVTARGIVWSISPEPVTSLSSKTVDGSGAGMFVSAMTDLLPGPKYYVRAYATNSAGTSYGEEQMFSTLDLMDASNCFIIFHAGTYAFKAVKGNSDVSVGSVKSVAVLWESFGTSTAPKVGDLLSSVSCKDDRIVFHTSDVFRKGNAVIAAKDASGKILWSWHIWLTDQLGKCVYANNAGTVMDRNLGATSATPGDVGALGLLYQWGRKDPFLGSSSISNSVEAKSTITWPSSVLTSSSSGMIGYAVEHPTTFIMSYYNNYDWYYTGSSSTDDTRWQSAKTIYDPCPAGWRVPDGGENGVWNKAGFDDRDYDDSDEGMLFDSGISSPATWYPASGFRRGSDGTLDSVGNNGNYWSVTPNGNFAYSLYFSCADLVFPKDNYRRAYGKSVRCQKE